MTVDPAKLEELSRKVAAAAGHYADERSTVGARYSQVIRELGRVLTHYQAGDIEAAKQAVKQACDIAYDLTGDCEQMDAIAELVGYDEPPASSKLAEATTPGAVIDAEVDEELAELAGPLLERVREWLLQAGPRLVRTLGRDGIGECSTLTLRLRMGDGDYFEVALREEVGLGEVSGRVPSKPGAP